MRSQEKYEVTGLNWVGSSRDCVHCVGSLFEIIQTLYFAVYGLTSIDVFRLDERHNLTQFVGKLMFGCYCGCMVIVLINMLIAMLSQAYETISVGRINAHTHTHTHSFSRAVSYRLEN